MYALATCRASIYRGSTTDEYGDEVEGHDASLRVAQDILAHITQRSVRAFDPSSGMPRVFRTSLGIMPSGTDVRTNDRIRDDTHGVVYTVNAVTTNTVPGLTPDTVLELERITS